MLAKLRTATREAVPFGNWLHLVTPTYDWTPAHLALIRTHLDSVTAGDCKRLALFLPPRHGKSAMTTVRYAAWRIERNPAQRIIIGAYNQDLAEHFSRQIRRIVRERGVELQADRQTAAEWETAQGGGVKAAGVGTGVTGRGADLIIIDDPVKSREEANSEAYRNRCWDWYTNDLYTRLEPSGAICLIQTRWHEDDLAGRILTSEQAADWQVVNLPAEAEAGDPLGRLDGAPLWPGRFDVAALADIRAVMGQDYEALYQQRPRPPKGTLFQAEWFNRNVQVYERGVYSLVVQGWDTAFKEGQENDYTACVTIGRLSMTGALHVLNVYRQRVAFPELVRAIEQQAERWQPHAIVVEDKGSGTSAVQSLQRTTGLPIVAVPAEADKVARANRITAYCEAGKVSIPSGRMFDDLISELVRFPSGKHDDQVDAFVHALQRIASGTQRARVREY
jgi:predicted phage terminase large subunit-like protein